jgi:hypothetical protein
MWATRMEWNGKHWLVHLSRGDVVVATLSLDDWAKLSATKLLVEDRDVAEMHRLRDRLNAQRS